MTAKFTCIYCGFKKDLSERTKEHVIPQCVYGKFVIREVCRDCNSKMGRLIDQAFPDYIPHAVFLKTGVLNTGATACLKDGSTLTGKVIVVEQRTKNGPYEIVKFENEEGTAVDRSLIQSVKVLAYDFENTKRVTPGIVKVAFGGIHYLLNYQDHRFQHLDYVNCPELSSMRRSFNPKAIKYPRKKPCDFTIERLMTSDRKAYIGSFTRPEIRRNAIRIRQRGTKVEIMVVLLSQWVWRVKVDKLYLPAKDVSAESLLPELMPIEVPSGKPVEYADKIYVEIYND